jgi:subtilisin family serine protease
MREFIVLLLVVLFAAVYTENIPGQFIVVFKKGMRRQVSISIADDIALASGGQITKRYSKALNGFAIKNVAAAGETALASDPNVDYIIPDTKISIQTTQTVPSSLYHLDRDDQRNRPLDGKYNYNKDGTGITAYVLDTGIRPTHTEFGGRAAVALDALGGNGIDCHGHGTHVSALIGGVTYGIAKKTSIRGVRVLNCDGTGTNSNLIAGIDWVIQNAKKPAIMSMSLTGGANAPTDTAINNAINSGITVICAAGNNADLASNYSPARVPNAVTVGATGDTSDAIADFSNYGPTVDIFAPGTNVLSAGNASDTATIIFSGTSQATPQVAGLIALYLSCNPSLTPSSVISLMKSDSTKNIIPNANRGEPNNFIYTGNVCASATTTTTRGPTTTTRGPTTTTRRPTTTTTTRGPTTTTCPPVPKNCPCGIIIPAGKTCKRCKINCSA